MKGASMTPCQKALNRSSTAAGYPSSRAARTSATAAGAPVTVQSTPAARTTTDSPPAPRMIAAPGSRSQSATECWKSTSHWPDAMAIAEGRCDVLFQHSVPDWDRLPGATIIRGVGGESRVVEAGGRSWHVTGVPSAVAEVCDRLRSG